MQHWIMASFFIGGFVVAAILFGGARLRDKENAQAEAKRARNRGVYAIKNNATGAVYVGSTSRAFVARWGEHIAALDCGKHDNGALQRDWLIYGAEAFSFIVVKEMGENKSAIQACERDTAALLYKRLPAHLIYNNPGFWKLPQHA